MVSFKRGRTGIDFGIIDDGPGDDNIGKISTDGRNIEGFHFRKFQVMGIFHNILLGDRRKILFADPI